MRALRIVPLLLGLVAGCAAAAERWQLQYFHDEDDSRLAIVDLQFADPQRGIAVGYYSGERGRVKAAGVVTSDGGKTWSPVRVPDAPKSLFLLNERLGWLVTSGRIWQTTELGRDWKPVARLRDVERVYFLDENRGFAVGTRKSAWETSDGGKHWTQLAAAGEPKTTRDYSVYQAIAFANRKNGMIAGWSKRPREDRRRVQLPDWMDPAQRPRETPGMALLLETHDGGSTWTASQASMFGRITRVRLRPDGVGLGLIEFFDAFDWACEVVRVDWREGKSFTVFREKNRTVTDIALPAGGPAYLAAVEPSGALPRSPVPGKLKILRSDDLARWTEMPVDYRAVATRAVFAAPAPGRLWVATDTGMILKLISD
jgi:photosystem II stability/assembly factor-like uncharacterized protein